MIIIVYKFFYLLIKLQNKNSIYNNGSKNKKVPNSLITRYPFS